MPYIKTSATKPRPSDIRFSAPLIVICLVVICLGAAMIDTFQAHREEGLAKAAPITAFQAKPTLATRQALPPPVPILTAWNGPVDPAPESANQMAPVYDRIPTEYPVVFLGIDDGWTRTPDISDWLTSHQLPFTLFLTDDAAKEDYNYFKDFVDTGATVEDHSLHHSDFSKMSYQQQADDICQTADTYSSVYGSRPNLFRPPYGAFNADTQHAAAICAMKAVIMWHATIDGGAMHYQDNNTHLMPGDIVLMHFRPDFTADMQAFAQAADSQHLQVGRLEDWLPE